MQKGLVWFLPVLGGEGEFFLPVNPSDDDPGAEVRLGDVVGAVLADEPGEEKV